VAGVYTALFALAAGFRFLALKNGFVNDHFVYISGGRQMLFGEWPTRDWIDPGLPLMFGADSHPRESRPARRGAGCRDRLVLFPATRQPTMIEDSAQARNTR
jgi:hypothetical protein